MDPRLRASYRFCRSLHRAHGRTYYLATRFLPAARRWHVHALYGFTRHTDEIVDDLDGVRDPASRAAALSDWTARFRAGFAGGPVDDPVLPAFLHTARVCRLDPVDIDAFLRSMELDLTVTEYPTYDDLLDYMAGSAAAVGSMMLPVLGTRDRDAARAPARQLGLAFQLTNFIRDVAEDLRRGRVYLPLKDLARFGVTVGDLRAGVTTAPIRALVAHEVDRARQHYALAAPGIDLLAAASRPAIRTAYRVYAAILDEVERSGYDVLGRRAVVPTSRRLALAGASLLTLSSRPRG